MKTAYQYIRISDEDQSNFSISGQQLLNQQWAQKKDVQIIGTFIDDGYSAKDFNRPEWKRMEAALSKSKVDYLIVTKYDRMIRNVVDGLSFIKTLEQKWKITLISVMENYSIDIHDPYFFKHRADMFVDAEFERRRISDRSRFGIWSAKTQGRFVGRAPFGYNNMRDEKDTPILTINEAEREIVQQIFSDFLNDLPFRAIIHAAKQKGFSLKSHDAIKRIISNHIYAGLLLAPQYKDEKAKVVKATHAPIIPEETFWQAYYKLQNKINPQGPKICDENVPLRGFLLCQQCGRFLTGGPSKGKYKIYYYYRCLSCSGENHSANKAHDELDKILKGLSLPDRMLKAIEAESLIGLDQELESRTERLKRVTRDYDAIKTRVSSLEEKYIGDKIDHLTYSKWKGLYLKEFDEKEREVRQLQSDDDQVRSRLTTYLPYASDLQYIYQSAAEIQTKQDLLKGVFPACLIKEKEGNRTPFIHPMFYVNALYLKGLLRISANGNTDNFDYNPISTRNGNQIEHLDSFLRIIERIIKKAA